GEMCHIPPPLSRKEAPGSGGPFPPAEPNSSTTSPARSGGVRAARVPSSSAALCRRYPPPALDRSTNVTEVRSVGVLGECVGVGGVPVEAHLPEALPRLLDQFLIQPNDAEGAEDERLQVRAGIEQRRRLCLELISPSERGKRIHPGNEDVNVAGADGVRLLWDSSCDVFEVATREREMDAHRIEQEVVPLHPQGVRVLLEPASLVRAREVLLSERARQQRPRVVEARRSLVGG